MLGNLFNQKKSPVQPPLNPVGSLTAPASVSSLPVQALLPPQQPVQSPSLVGSSMEPSRRQDVSALSHLDPRTSVVLLHAQQEVMRIKQPFIEPQHLLFGLLFDEEIFKLLEQFSLDIAKISREIQSKEKMGNFTGQPTFSEASKHVFESAYQKSKERGSEFITPEDVLTTLFESNVSGSEYLKEQGLQEKDLEEKMEKTVGFTASKRSLLEKFGLDLTEQAKQGLLDPVTGRDKEIERLVHILLRRTKNNPIIIGEAGVGKTAVVEGLAQAIVSGKAPKDLESKRIIQIEMASLVAGASHRGEFEERLRNLVKEAIVSSGQIILFVDEIHTLVGTGDTEGALDASNIIKPFLARGQLQIIGTTTTAEYRKYFEKDKAFERRFQPIIVEEPDEDTALQMLEVLKPKYEKFHSVVLTPEALIASVHLSKKYIGERYLPDKAVDLLDEAAAQVRLENTEGRRSDNQVQKADIEKVVSSWTGIPITRLTEDESQKLLNLDKLIHQRLIDQEEAVQSVAEAVRRGRIGLSAANRPIASFIFLGPTGVGKTELAKTLAEILFGRDDLMVRLDMSEYMEKHEVAKLIGAPPGYVGYEEGGQLTEAVRAKPYSIVLLDEVEKAHPDVFNILLQLLEDGRLTDNKGNTISFKNTIVIATSNIGSTVIQQELSKPTKSPEEFDKAFQKVTEQLMTELHKFFKPELLNRFDQVVLFKPLGADHMIEIARLGIEKTRKLLKEQGFELTISENALKVLAKDGYDPVYGARPLRRLIQSSIENPIALQIIGKTYMFSDTIAIDYDDKKQEFTFTRIAAVQPTQPQVQAPTDQLPVVNQSTQAPTIQEPIPVQTSVDEPVQPSVPTPPVQTPAEPQPDQGPIIPPQSPQQPLPVPSSTGVAQTMTTTTSNSSNGFAFDGVTYNSTKSFFA